MPTDAASPIRLLHLSDIHVRVDRAWDSDPLLRALARTIAADVRAGLVPDLVVITGDLAHSGTAEEYDQAGDWLSRRLWPVLSPDPARPLPCERLLLVPGNHDCDRTLVGRPIRNTQQALLATPRDQFQEAVAECLGDPDECARLIKRHRAWLDFYGDWLNRPPGEARARPWWQRTLVLQGQRLHLAGLDSAWMACGDEDRGRLLLGRRQLGDTVLHRDAEGADWRLALMHHPWDSLAECDAQDARQTIHLACDLLLRGHLHQGEAAFIRPPDPARACLEVAAGSVYDGSHRPNSFHWIELWPATKTDPRRVRLLFRAWRKGAWQIDRNQPGCPDGTAEFRFDTAPAPETGPGTPPRPAVPPAYQAWLCQRYSGIDLLGQPVQQGQAVTLRQVYVPAVTTPERPSEPTPDRGEGPPPALLLQRLAVTSLYCPGPAGAGKSTFCRWAVVPGLPGPVPAHPVLGRGLGGRHLQQQRGQARGDLPGRALPPLPAGPAAAR